MITTIAGKELKSLFLSPLAWVVLAVVQFLLAYFFLLQVDQYLAIQPRLAAMEGAPGVTDVIVAPLFGNAAIIMLLVAPLVTMRLISEERRNGTLGLLTSAPITPAQIVLGKYLGVMAFFGVMLALAALMPLSLLLGGSLDFGKLAGGLLGIGLLVAAFAAAGLFMSSLTGQPTIAAVATFGLLLLLWIIDWAARGRDASEGVLGYLSVMGHYQSLLRGLVNSTDVVYYLLFIAVFLALAVRRLEAERLNG